MNQVCFTEVFVLWSLLEDFFCGQSLTYLQKTETSLSLSVCVQISALSLPLLLTNLSLSARLRGLVVSERFPMLLSVCVEENNISARNKRQIARDIER